MLPIILQVLPETGFSNLLFVQWTCPKCKRYYNLTWHRVHSYTNNVLILSCWDTYCRYELAIDWPTIKMLQLRQELINKNANNNKDY